MWSGKEPLNHIEKFYAKYTLCVLSKTVLTQSKTVLTQSTLKSKTVLTQSTLKATVMMNSNPANQS